VPERVTVSNRSEKSAEAVVAAGMGRRAERGEVFKAMSMQYVMRQMPAPAGRAGVARGEAARDSVSDEADCPRHDTGNTGSALLMAVLTRENLQRAFKRVRANKGAAGVDGLDIDQTARQLATTWPAIREQLLRGTYRPSPVRRVTIPKPDGGERELGIPTVTDRLIQQALLQVLQPILDPTFSEHSYGFRPGRRAHDAVLAAQSYVQSGRRVVVDVDLEKFFDRVNHDILIDRLRKRIDDAGILRLIRAYLNSGIMSDGVVQERHQGTPQGGPLSPLLANVLLDEVDKELERRGHCFARYADDCNVYVGSRKAGERVLAVLRRCYAKLRLDASSWVTASGLPRKGLNAAWPPNRWRRSSNGCGNSPGVRAGAAWRRLSNVCGLTSWGGKPTSGWRKRRASGVRWMNGCGIGSGRFNSSTGSAARPCIGNCAHSERRMVWRERWLPIRAVGGATARAC
jgi:group II intron reverse transcriptase/maturase